MTIELKNDWKRDGLKTVKAGTVIQIDQALFEKLDKKGLFTEKKKETKKEQKLNN
jgi:hypothetical protein|tara:strand:- start:379 stop:543 length:165 start_codon:yes stop_codon:yes gene_type:complete